MVWKSYMVLTKSKYRIVMFLIYPILIFAYAYLLMQVLKVSSGNRGLSINGVQLMVFSMILFLEILSDHWMLGGIFAKNESYIECLKGSKKGKKIYLQTLAIDMFRRISVFIVAGEMMQWVGCRITQQAFHWLNLPMLLSTIICIWGVFITRFFETVISCFSIGYACHLLVYFSMFFPEKVLSYSVIKGILLLVLIVISVAFIMWYAVQKMEESYSDK